MENDIRFFNPPISLYRDVYKATRYSQCNSIDKIMNDIFDYSIFKFSLPYKTLPEKKKQAENYFGITIPNIEKTISHGELLYSKILPNTATTGISVDMLLDYWRNKKYDYENDLLLAFLGLKSIIGTKKLYKTTVNMVLNRMAGNTRGEEYEKLPKEILKYKTTYHWRKLICDLEMRWGLKYYSRYTKGFYFSFSLSKKQLIIEAEKAKKTNEIKEFKRKNAELITETLKELKSEKAL